jgi:serine/threonine protein kinase
LVTEQLSGPEHQTVAAHVETCLPCQERLELLVGNVVATTSPPRSGHRADPAPEPDDEFLQRLRQTPPPARASTGLGLSGVRAPDASNRSELQCLGPYELLARLGAGGMGTVYKARHRELEKIVALKVLPAERLNEVTLARFKQEMKAVGKLEHANLVGAHDAGERDGTHFLVMEFVDGVDLARLVARHGGLRFPDACALIGQAAAGLQHAWERGLVHRDIKPSNLMLARSGLVKVLDLGLARSLGDTPLPERLTATGLVLGTADYMAPEQWESAHTADVRADIYSLGCTLYHLLAGTPPFGGLRHSSWLKKMRAHLETPVPPIQQHRPEVPGELVAVLERMLAKDPADRFTTPAEVAAALQPFTAGSDLARLLAPGAAGSGQSQLALRPVPSTDAAERMPTFQETPAPATRRGRIPELVRRHYGRLATVAGCGLLLAAALVLGPRLWNALPSAAPAEKPLRILAMRIHHFRGEEAKPLGEMGTTSAGARLDDDVRVVVELSAPAYCYLIAFNPDGTEQLCFPEEDDEKKARALAPARLASLRFPQTKYFGLDATGLQAFVLVASTQRLPPYAQWRSALGAIPWERVEAAGVWRFDGQELVPLPRERGQVRERGGQPKPLLSLCNFFQSRPEFEAVHVLAFPVTKD